MKTRKGRHLTGTAGLMMLMSGSAFAQEVPGPAPAAEQTDTTEIVVTAQKREQRLIDVPVAITAVTADALTTQNLNRIQDFYDRVPGLQYSGQRINNLSLRGITTGGQTSATVALLVDDVQFGGIYGQPPIPDFDASAIDRVEVLRGPQGTLYGAASLGGLIKYVLKQPDTERLSGRVELGGTAVTNGGEGYSARGTVNIPVTDWLAVLGSGFKRDDAPYLDNVRTGRADTNTRDAWGYRAAVLVKPFDALRLTGSVLRQKVDAINSDLAITSGGVPICAACTTLGTAATRALAPTTFEPVYGDLTINALDSINRSVFSLYSGRADLEIGRATLTSVSAWGKLDNVINSDVSAVFAFLRGFYGDPSATTQIANADVTTKFTQEVRMTVSSGPFDFLAGGFYTVEHSNVLQTLLLRNAGGSLIATPYAATGPTRYREVAGFADVTWHLTDKLEVQVGGRYAANKQSGTSRIAIDSRAVPAFGPSQTTSFGAADQVFTYLVSPTYRFTDDIMAYLRVANGYRPGGPNVETSGQGNFGSDRVVNYELGFKGRIVPGLLTVDTALFMIDWKDIQLQGTAPSNLTVIANGGKARSRGIEFAANLTPWRGMSLDGNIALTDAEITENLPPIGAAGLVGRDGDRLPFTARVAGSVTAAQRFDLAPALKANLTVNWTHVGDRPGAFNVASGTRPRIMIPAYNTLNLTAAFTINDSLTVTAYLRNALDERGISAAQNRNGANVPTALFIQPQTYGLTLAKTF